MVEGLRERVSGVGGKVELARRFWCRAVCVCEADNTMVEMSWNEFASRRCFRA